MAFIRSILRSVIVNLIVKLLIAIWENWYIILPSVVLTLPVSIIIVEKIIIDHDHPHSISPAKEQVTLIGFSCEYDNTDNKHYCGYTFISDVNPPSQSCSIKDDTGKVFKEINFNKPSESKEKIPVDNPQGHIIFDCGKDFKVSIDVVDRPGDKLQEGIDAYNAGKYKKAREIFEDIDRAGKDDKERARAQNYIGNLYRYGHGGVPQDYGIAREWYEESAGKEDSLAQHNLAHRYEFGQDIEKNCYEAEKWFRKAEDNEDEAAGEHLDNWNCVDDE